MRSLYFKIFMWFWLAMALVGTALVISTVTTQTGEGDSRWRPLVAAGLELNGQRAIDVYEQDGRDGLVSFFDRLEDRTNMRAYLFDADSMELSGRELPEGSTALVAEASGDEELAVRELDDDDDQSRLVALQITTPSDAAYIVLAEIRRPFRGGGRSRGGYDGRRGGGSGDDHDDERGRRGDQPGEPSQGAAPGEPRQDGSVADTDGAQRNDFRGGGRGDGRFGGQRGGRGPDPWYGFLMSGVEQPGVLAFRLLAVFLTAGLVCYGLARYLTAPVQKLRTATHQFAGGDLSARVGPDGGRRDELAELGRDFDRMAERIETLLITQRQLLSDVSHELRSPLARLNVALALARQRAGDDAAGQLDRIEAEAEQLNQMIGQVLELSRLESGAADPRPVAVDLDRLVTDVAADADFEAQGRDSAVRVSSSVACCVQGTEQLLRSAVENVVRNAVRYTADGSDVDISLATSSDEAVITVHDRGPGIPEEHLEEVFQPFYRLEDARDRESGGTGLGLAITERAVRLHGGTVSAANDPEGGLVVELRLPL